MSDQKKYFEKLGCNFAKNHGEFLKLIPSCPQFNSEQIKLIYKALYKATELHKGQKRKSGEPYITHPIGAASILAQFGLDYLTVVGALLHDVVEDTEYTLGECERDFGTNVTKIVDGVTKIGNDVNDATHEKIIKASKEEPRIIAVKVGGDRLHNMYTLDALKPYKQIELATETKEFYVPITKILGIYQLKDELQDLCQYYLNKEESIKINKIREQMKFKYNDTLEQIGSKTQEILSKSGIAMRYEYRIKNFGSIYEEMENGSNLNDIDDLLAIKMVLNDPLMCYEALGAIHSISKPIKDSFKDFIASPKNNGYRSLNTNVLFKDANIQVRIRTNDMQNTNNLGVFSDLNDDVKNRLSSDMKKELDRLSKKR